ncbi:MAG: DUF4097 family beta strand repeat-containing protein [Candidatus Omnitrophota bacterium]
MKTNYRWIMMAAFAVCCLLAYGCDFNFPQEEYVEEEDFTVDATGAAALDSDTTNGAIVLTGVDSNQVKVHSRKVVRAWTKEEAENFAPKVKIHVEREGDVVKVYSEQPKTTFKINVSVHFTIEAPKSLMADLHSTNGKVAVSNMTNGVKAHTTNGGIELENVDGRIEAGSTNGGLKAVIGELKEEGEFSTTNGGVNVTISKGVAPIRVSSTNGGLTVKALGGVASLKASTTNGGVNVTLPPDFNGQLDASTWNGRVSCDFPIDGKVTKKSIYGKVGSGGDAKVNISSTNGSVSIKKENPA